MNPLPSLPRAPLGSIARLARHAARAALSPLFLIALLGLLLACSPDAPTEHAGHGIAVDVDPTARTVTLDHGEIPGLMQAMTMTFPVSPEVDLTAVEKGSTVDFEVRSEGSTITVTAIEKAGEETETQTAPQAP